MLLYTRILILRGESFLVNRRRAAMSFIFVTVALDMLALGIIIPVWPTLVKSFTGANDSKASLAIGLMSVLFAATQFFAAPILGVLSDRFGRRPVVLLSNLGTAIDYVIMALAPSILWLYVGRALSGVMSASIPTAYAYIADVTPPEKRAGAYGLISGAFGLGFVVGPALGGWLGGFDPRLPFWVAAALGAANFLYGLVVLPESLPAEKRRVRSELQRANPLGSLRLLRSHRELFGIATVVFIGYIAHEVYPTVYVLYGQHRYGWNTATLGIGLAIVGISSVVVSVLLSQRAVDTLGARNALLSGLFFGGVGFWMFGSPSTVLFWIAIPINALWGIAGSAEQVFMTSRVRHDEQGELQGALGALRSVAMIGAPMIFAGIFAYFIRGGPSGIEFPAAPWYLAAVLLFASIPVAWVVTGRAQVAPAVPEAS
ncbi:MAG: Tetracyclineefflux transporter [Candidatus Eremiobacteraeota bacterium]|nr:Tetracyclineefflux transporter [Candidatus Eremiobacteraeota bacterium]